MSSDELRTGADGGTGEAAPLGERLDMAAFASMETSQFVAVAMGSAKDERDPFEPRSQEELEAALGPALGEEPAAELEPVLGDEPAPEGEPEPAPEEEPAAEEPASPEVTAEEPPVQADEPASDAGTPEEEDASPYSRENASYTHRRGWAGLSTGKRAAIVIVVILALVLGIGGVAVAAYLNNIRNAAMVDDSIQEVLTPVEEEMDPYWVLVLGSDSRAESTDRARSDVLMMVRIDPNTPTITLVSIPRDTKVYIEGYGTQKINAAYALGGAELAINTVEDYAGIKISHYAEIYFSGLEDLVDQLGGVTVDVPEYCSYSDVTLYPGVQELTGHEALIFARCRKTYAMGDFTRTQCQRILLQALVEKVLAQPATALPGVIESATRCFSTDIPLEDLVVLATKLQGISSESFYSAMCPSTTGMVGGVSYTFTYINQWKLLMERADAGENPKLTKKEQEICGYTSTSYTELDMDEPLPEDVQEQLQAYWDKKAARAAAKQQKELEAQAQADAGEQGAETEA